MEGEKPCKRGEREVPSLVTSQSVRIAQLCEHTLTHFVFTSFCINIANGGLRTILNWMHFENNLSSCPKGTGYKEESELYREEKLGSLFFSCSLKILQFERYR